MHKKIFIVGAFHEIIELAEECGCEIVGFIDQQRDSGLFGYPVLCDDSGVAAVALLLAGAAAVLTPDQPAIRRRLYEHYAQLGFSFASLISPGARISKSAQLAEGVVIQWHAQVSAGSKLGRFVKLNTGANIMHDSTIGDFSTVAPSATVLGRVRVGSDCYIGANATLLPGVVIGDHAVVGAGAVVTKNVPQGAVVVGNPARHLR